MLAGCFATCAVSLALDEKPREGAPPPQWTPDVLDTFFPDAREQLQGERPDYSAAARRDVAPRPSSAGEPAVQTAGTFGWSALVRPETLEDEIKRLSQQLAMSVALQSEFKGGAYRACRRDFSWLAVLFAVIGEYDAAVRWHDEAPVYRDLFARAGFNCKAGSDQSFQEALLRSQDLQNAIRGSRIDDAESEPPPREAVWPDVSDRSPLMQRMEAAHQEHLEKWLASPAEFRSNLQEIRHEAELLAVLAEVISREGYDFSDDEEYAAHADQVRTGARAIVDAVATEDYTRARDAAAKTTKACTNCHDGYR